MRPAPGVKCFFVYYYRGFSQFFLKNEKIKQPKTHSVKSFPD